MGGREQIQKIIYIGDGGGDFCPSTTLDEKDLLLARRGWTLHKKVSAAAGGEAVRSKVVPWEDGKDIARAFNENLFNSNP